MQIKIPRDRFFQIDLSKFYLIDKKSIMMACFYVGMLIAYYGSLHPWFMWPLKELYVVPASAFLMISYLVSNSMKVTMFSRMDFLWPFAIYVILSYYMVMADDANVFGYIANAFFVAVFFILFKVDRDVLNPLLTVICKSMAILLIVSMFFFFLYLAGFNLPNRSAVFGDNQYSFSNYYFFMIDDRFMLVLIPRFQSVFLEPGHLGSATTLLLMTQMGKWKKWWNVVLIIASVITFSLAAYAILIALIFLSQWVQHKNVIKLLIVPVVLIAVVVGGAMVYNGGDNMVNNMIVSRLEVDETTGDIVGNNRVDKDFEKEFDKYIVSSDAFFGRDMEKNVRVGTGNSGYRVFIYKYGLVGLFILIMFYGFSFRGYVNVRYLVVAVIISVLIFWIRAYPLWFSNFIPLLMTVYGGSKELTVNQTERAEK